MKRQVLVLLAAMGLTNAARALRIPPGGGCPPNTLCEAALQLLAIPAFFEVTAQTDPSQPRDWVRIQNAGRWVKVVVAGDTFERKAGADLQSAQAQFGLNVQAGQSIYGYVFTGHGLTVSQLDAMADVQTWHNNYAPAYMQGVFFDVGPTFDPNQIFGVNASYETGTASGFQGFESYYEDLYSTVHSTLSWRVMLNASQWPDEWILSHPATDEAILWEDSLDSYKQHWGAMPCGTTNNTDPCLGNVENPPPAWWASTTYTSNFQIAHVVFKATQLDVASAVQSSWTPAENRTASLFYLYDKPEATYSGVACYFEQEIEALAGSTVSGGSTWCGTCSGQHNCVGACADLSSDAAHCGTCDNSCPAGWSCQSAQCVAPPPPNCPSGTQDCNGDGSRCVAPPRSCF
jgi:hypothetical protein